MTLGVKYRLVYLIVLQVETKYRKICQAMRMLDWALTIDLV